MRACCRQHVPHDCHTLRHELSTCIQQTWSICIAFCVATLLHVVKTCRLHVDFVIVPFAVTFVFSSQNLSQEPVEATAEGATPSKANKADKKAAKYDGGAETVVVFMCVPCC